jgi:hypothetical protein
MFLAEASTLLEATGEDVGLTLIDDTALAGCVFLRLFAVLDI